MGKRSKNAAKTLSAQASNTLGVVSYTQDDGLLSFDDRRVPLLQ